MGEIRKVKGFEKKTFIDVINGTVNMPLPEYIDILNRSDAAKATYEKQEIARKLDRKEHGYNVRVVGGGFAEGGLWMPNSRGEFYANMNHYPEYSEGGSYQDGGGGGDMLVGGGGGAIPQKSSNNRPLPSAPTVVPVGASENEVFSSFLFNELGAS